MKNMANLKKIATELFWKFSSPERLSLHKSSILREVSACPRDSRVVLFRLASFLLEALSTDY
jgi:hypothetical protein